MFDVGGCYDDQIPHAPPPDLVIMESAAGNSQPQAAERLIWRLAQRAADAGRQRPAVLYINTVWVTSSGNETW